MAVQTPRPPVTTTTPASRYVTDGAIRLFVAGYARKLTFVEQNAGIFTYTIPSESDPDATYVIDHDIYRRTLQCSCPAGQNNVPCKHVQLFRFLNGMVEGARA